MKRLRSAVAVVALLLTLAGCGKSDPVYFGCGGSHRPCPGEKTDPNTAMCDAIVDGDPNANYSKLAADATDPALKKLTNGLGGRDVRAEDVRAAREACDRHKPSG